VISGFTADRIDAGGIAINLERGGEGPPVLLLHGYPQTHVMWRRVAPALAEHFTVVCPDLRGYGDSEKPRDGGGGRAYSKRVMAADQVALMRSLGFDRFAVVGHDRGARVALRMALDHPGAVSRLGVLDIVPTRTIYATLDRARATTVWRYFFLVQPHDLPERLIGADPSFYLDWTLDEWCGTPGALDDVRAEYHRCFDAATVHASCEDYRAGAGVDLADDEADVASRLACPVLLLWSREGLGAAYQVLEIWRERAPDVLGRALDCGHFLAEERPEETAAELQQFLSG
jgi:haloacetate dehalogenase